MIKVVLFDIDSTLLKGSKAHRNAFRGGFEEVLGLDAGLDNISAFGRTDPDLVSEVLSNLGFPPAKIKSNGSVHEYDSNGKKTGSFVESGNTIRHRTATGRTTEIIKPTRDGYRVYHRNGRLIGKVKLNQTSQKAK